MDKDLTPVADPSGVGTGVVSFTHIYVGAKGTDPRWIGQPCRVLIRTNKASRGKRVPRNAMVEFADGSRIVVPTYSGGKGATLRRIQ
jgi:hypothetical protein